MADPAVRAYINESVSGDPHVWPVTWFRRRFISQPFGLVLVPGCGTGELERDLLRQGICERVHAFDVAAPAIESARQRALEEGFADRIEYRVGELGGASPPAEGYDACVRQVAGWLRPGGILYLDEYVGPSRQQWDRGRFAFASAVFDLIPLELRLGKRLRIPGLMAKLSDPSESIASDRILGAVERHARILERRDYHGFLLQPVWTQIRHEEELVRSLIGIERGAAKLHPTWFTVLVATP
jgi:SAM-dependent methyltransferase